MAPKLEAPPRPEVAAQPALPEHRSLLPIVVSHAGAQAKPAEPKTPAVSAAPSRPERRSRHHRLRPAVFGICSSAGVFADPRRAEELHAKLTLEGIPSTIEARVQAGPFKSKEEASARIKMKALGIDAVDAVSEGWPSLGLLRSLPT